MTSVRSWLFAFALAGSAVGGSAQAVELHDEPKPLPPVSFMTMDGKEASLEDFKGQVVVLNFWATWCAPCKREMPSLSRLQENFDPQEVLVLALAADRNPPEKLRAWLDEIDVDNLAVYRDPEMATVRDLNVPGLPVTVVVDESGQEVARHAGYAEWDAPEIMGLIEEIKSDETG